MSCCHANTFQTGNGKWANLAQSHLHPSQPDGRVVFCVFPTEAELLLHECPDEKCPGGDQHQEQDDGQRDVAAGETRTAGFVLPGNHVLDANVVNCEKGIVVKRFVTR